jgi:hypothetical protein
MEIGAVESSEEGLTAAKAAQHVVCAIGLGLRHSTHQIASLARVLTTPEQIRPFPKAGECKPNARKPRKRGSTRILTDTPVKRQLEEEAEQRAQKKKQTSTKSHHGLKKSKAAM